MRLAAPSSLVPFLRTLAVVPVAVAVWLASPAPTSAVCYECRWSTHAPWPSWMCAEVDRSFEWGKTECEEPTTSSNGNTECERSGFDCLVIIITAENDQEAISDVMAGEELLADGAHFFIVDGDDAVVMRKCDLSVVARIPNHQIPQLDAELALATDRA